MDKPTILVIGTLDTKSDETFFLRSQILSHGSCSVKILDVGRTLQRAEDLQIPADELVRRMSRVADAPSDLPRGEMISAIIHRCIPIIEHLLASSLIQGMVAAGGSSGSSLATALMRKCPVGFPKLMVRYPETCFELRLNQIERSRLWPVETSNTTSRRLISQ
jgi:uncharacterized protein (UPF0261 family)